MTEAHNRPRLFVPDSSNRPRLFDSSVGAPGEQFPGATRLHIADQPQVKSEVQRPSMVTEPIHSATPSNQDSLQIEVTLPLAPRPSTKRLSLLQSWGT